MFRSLRFALTYALRNMRRDRQRAAFALFSVAVGVATVIALRMLGLMLTDALTDNVRGLLRGDISVTGHGFDLRISSLPSNRAAPMNAQNIPAIDKWAADHGVDIQYSLAGALMQTATVRNGLAGQPAFVQGYFIDPKRYPFYNTIRADFPAGVALADLLNGPDQLVVGRRVADQLGIKVGDTMRIGAAKDLYTVMGIVPDNSEGQLTNPFSLLFSFVYVDRQYADQFGLDPHSADNAYLRLPPGTSDADLSLIAHSIPISWPPDNIGRGWITQTTTDVLARNKQLADLVSRFVLLLSLIALVIGGVSIVNTMLVSVNRRSTEIAVLKTLGLKGRGVLVIFLVEALILGLIGSLLGIGLGLLLSLVAQQFGEQAFGIALPWRFHIEPLILGVGLGLITTAIFSTLPTLMAAQVRPGSVLRQGTIVMSRAGCLPSVISLTVLIVGIGALVDAIVGNPFSLVVRGGFRSIPVPPHPGILATLLAFIAFGIIFGLMWTLVWLLGKLPSFRNPNLRIAIRGLTLYRSRTALSLLALIVGMSALGGTLIMSRSINLLLQSSVSGPLGGNVVVLPLPVPLLDTAGLARQKLDAAPGVAGYRDLRFGQVTLAAINGDSNYRLRVRQLLDDAQANLLEGQLNFLLGVNVYGNPPRGKLVDGRYLTAADAGKNVIVIPYKPELDTLGVKVGSTFTYQIGSDEHSFQVVGIVAADPQQGLVPFSLGDGAIQTPLDSLTKSNGIPDLIIASVKPEQVKDAMAVIGTAPGVFVFDVGIFDSFINRLLNQLAALPLLVAGLSLFAAGVLIATTVSLATIERRRQIGILKALGVKRAQALNQLLIENGIIGVVGGVISLLPTLAVIQLAPVLTENVIRLPVPYDLIALMLFLSVVITLGATLLTAWSASGEKPLTVLRYE